jgi:hypothetical protein
MDVLSTSNDDVQAWQEGFLNPEEFCLPGKLREFSQELAGLVAPLRHRPKPGEVMMFCLSTTLRRLPLHTLNICNSIVDTDEGNSQPLLHRILLSRFVVFLCFVLHSRLRSMLSIYIRRSVLIFYLAFQKQMRQLRLIDAKRTTQLRERVS